MTNIISIWARPLASALLAGPADGEHALSPACAPTTLFYWEKIDFGLKPTFRLNHAIAYESSDPRGTARVVAVSSSTQATISRSPWTSPPA